MNILTNVWLHPKQTVRHMIEHNLLKVAMVLVLLAGFLGTFVPIAEVDADGNLIPSTMSFVELLMTGALSSVIAFLFMFISVGIVFLVGKLFKGQGSYWDIYQATSLGMIPTMVMGVIGFVWAAFDLQAFSMVDFSSPMTIAFFAISAVLGIWSLVISVAALAEANHYSNWRAFFTLILPALLIVLVVVVLVLVVFAAFLG